MNEMILRRRWLFGLLVALVALGSSANTIVNRFTQDDVPLLEEDPRPKNPALWDQYLNEAYWPEPLQRDLYRPLTSLLIGVEWQMASGATFPFRTMQLTFYLASCIAFFALALRLLVPWAALAAALLFAVHPVHVEAVAVAVNQAEVIIGLVAAMAVAWYMGRRRSGPLTVREQAGLAAVTVILAHVKESGVMLPVLLFAGLVILDRRPWRAWKDEAVSLIVWQTLAVVLVLANRSRIYFDTATGSFIAEAFEYQPLSGRVMTMLRIVPEWLRLLLWPATLSADYSPTLIVPAEQWGAEQTLGLAILILLAVLAWRLRKTTPVATFGIAWCAIGLFPVSNALLPTGIPLAERTLFLPSVGIMLTVGAVLAVLGPRLARRRAYAWATGAVVGLIVVLGASRSHSRHKVWRNNNIMWAQTVIDNPSGYRPRLALGSILNLMGRRDRAIALYQQSLELWDKTWGANFWLGTWFRTGGNCPAAVPHYRRVLAIKEVEAARTSLVACLAWMGEYTEAKREALPGIGGEEFGPILRVWYRTVDAAAKQDAPPHTVVFPKEYEHLLLESVDKKNVE
jgi:hypothetical protein